MFFTIFLIFIFSKITRILSINNDFPIYSLEQEVIKEISLDNINLNSKIIYIISTNNISGTYTYDIQSPYLLELSYGKSDYSFKLPDLFSGNFHKNEKKERYFYSCSVKVNKNKKYTFLKIYIKDKIDNFKDNKSLKLLLVKNYTWKIVCFCSFLFFFEFIIIIYIFCCKREFLIKFCNFRKENVLQNYNKIPGIYELNFIDIPSE